MPQIINTWTSHNMAVLSHDPVHNRLEFNENAAASTLFM